MLRVKPSSALPTLKDPQTHIFQKNQINHKKWEKMSHDPIKIKK